MDIVRAVTRRPLRSLFVVLVCAAVARWYANDALAPEDAFRVTANLSDDGELIEAHFRAAKGYYLYQESLGFSSSGGVALGAPRFPPASVKFDDVFERNLPIYRGEFVVKLPVEHPPGRSIEFVANLQGCSDRGLCYPPETRRVEVVDGHAARITR
jgi:thiol:disulfide interchange protein DsbD